MAARRDKEWEYTQLLAGDQCRLVVVAINNGALKQVCGYAGRSQGTRGSVSVAAVQFAWRCRWQRMSAVSCARAVASSLVSGLLDPMGTDGPRQIWRYLFQM